MDTEIHNLIAKFEKMDLEAEVHCLSFSVSDILVECSFSSFPWMNSNIKKCYDLLQGTGGRGWGMCHITLKNMFVNYMHTTAMLPHLFLHRSHNADDELSSNSRDHELDEVDEGEDSSEGLDPSVDDVKESDMKFLQAIIDFFSMWSCQLLKSSALQGSP
ncbi:hypothetical protein P692DRAFT_201807681 [Suillus brevipes Sb2]|nr:hypothetical protein P692DRAFT_201807681 [Suillus brevipes Sb2]